MIDLVEDNVALELNTKVKVVEIDVRVLNEIRTEWLDDTANWAKQGKDFLKNTRMLSQECKHQQEKQARLSALMTGIRASVVKVANDTDWFQKTVKRVTGMYQKEEHRCVRLKERVRLRNFENNQGLLRLREVKHILAMKSQESASCPGGCGENGVCYIPDGKDTTSQCICNLGYYDANCESKMCPGLHGAHFTADMEDACHGGECAVRSGTCESCTATRFSGRIHACELTKCPVLDCSGHGECELSEGKCHCDHGFSGAGCEHRSCPGLVPGELYSIDEHHACSGGRGVCDGNTGKCKCNDGYLGAGCEKEGCMKGCSGNGKCDTLLAQCVCKPPFSGPACETIECPNDCSGHGLCDKLTGHCTCHDGYVGEACAPATTCQPYETDWWTVMDKAGWARCPRNHYITGLYRNSCDALACLEQARCEKPCGGSEPLLHDKTAEVCYTASWHDVFDKKGAWAICERGFFLSGFYRSRCDSLYCLELAKCCGVPKGSWGHCEEVPFAFQAAGWATAPKNYFLSGLYRAESDGLSGITRVRACQHSYNDAYVRGTYVLPDQDQPEEQVEELDL